MTTECFIGGLSEPDVRGIAAAVLDDGNVTAGFVKAFVDADTLTALNVNNPVIGGDTAAQRRFAL